MINPWLLIFLLLVSTYVSRILGVELMAKRDLNPTVRLYFSYVPIAIMAALIIQQFFTSSSSGQLTISYPVLFGALTTAISIRYIKQFLPSVILGMVVGIIVRNFLI